MRILKTYGEQAIQKVRSNPYMLAKDIYGIGFATADHIAQKQRVTRSSKSPMIGLSFSLSYWQTRGVISVSAAGKDHQDANEIILDQAVPWSPEASKKPLVIATWKDES